MRSLREEELSKLKSISYIKGITELRTAIYARKSTEDKTDTSITVQIEQCKELIQRNEPLLSFDEKLVFQEEKVSGYHIDKRPEFVKLLNLVEEGEIDVIVTHDFDRFARNLVDTGQLIQRFQELNVSLITGDDNGDNSATGILMKHMIWSMNEFKIRNIAEHVMKVHTKLAKDGKTVGGIGNYGYKIINRKYHQDKSEAPAVLMVYDLFLEGKSYSQIADELESKGYKPRKSLRFSGSSLHYILTNTRNYGKSIWNAESKRKGGKRILQQEYEEVESKDVVINPIISEAKFDRVQELLSTRTRGRVSSKGTAYLLTSLLKCSCGGSLVGNSHKKKGRESVYRTYKCKNHSKTSGHFCPTKAINAKYLGTYVKKQIISIINQHIKSNPITNDILSEYLDEEKAKTKRLNRELRIEEKLLKGLIKGYHLESDMNIKALTKEQITESSSMIELFKDKLRYLNKRISIMKDRRIYINKGELKISDVFTNDVISRRIVQIFVKKITVSNESIEMEFL